MAGLTTSTELSSSYGMSENKVKSIIREGQILYDTNNGSYICIKADFDKAYIAKRFQTCGTKVANKTRTSTREANEKKAARQAKTTK